MAELTKDTVLKALMRAAVTLGITGLVALVVLLTFIGVPALLFEWYLPLQLAGGLAALLSVGYAARRLWRKHRLRRRARTSLVARAELEGLALDGDMRVDLGAFDDAYAEILTELRKPGLDRSNLSLLSEGEVREAQARLFRLVSAAARLRADMQRLTPRGSHQAPSPMVEEMRKDLVDIGREIGRLRADTETLWHRLVRMRQLSQQPLRAPGDEADLTGVLSELDRAVSAFREIDEARAQSVEQRVDRLLKQARTKQGA